MQLVVIVEGGDQFHSLEVPYDSDLIMVIQLIQSEVIIFHCCVLHINLYPQNFNA